MINPVTLAIIAGFFVALWLVTRPFRRSWYPRFGVEIALALIFVGIVAVGYLGNVYERAHPNRGEQE